MLALKIIRVHWNRNFVILMKFSSLAALKVVILTTFSAASDENFVKMTTFPFGGVGPPPGSVSNCHRAPVNARERTQTACERQRTPQSATERDATATKRTDSVAEPPLNQFHSYRYRLRAQVNVCERTTTVMPWRKKAEPPHFVAFLYGSQVGGVTTVFDQKPPMCNRGFNVRSLIFRLG